MNRFLLLLLIAGIVFLVILFAARPDLLGNVWMWIIGLIGGIIIAFQSLAEYIKGLFTGKKDTKEDLDTDGEKSSIARFKGTTIDLLRVTDDGDTTIGLITVNGQYFATSLEDSASESAVTIENRIPAGIFPVTFRSEETELTRIYRERFPEWFTHHIQLKDVPGFGAVYLYNGGDQTGTKGCILVTALLSSTEESKVKANAIEAYKRLYLFLQGKLIRNIPVRIRIRDEQWIKEQNQ